MEALGVAANIIAVLQAANAIISICCDYSAAVKGAPWELPKVTKEVRSLRDVLELLAALAKRVENADPSAEARLPALKLLCEPGAGPLAICKDELASLKTKLEPPKWTGPVTSKRTALMQTLSWPLKEGETKKILQNLERHKTTLNMALQIDQTTVTLGIHDMSQVIHTKTSEISEDLGSLKRTFSMSTLGGKLGKWLSAPDPSSNHNEACAKRQVTTGDWFIRGSNFAQWRKDRNSLLWLHGIPGCGKTILCSTVIEDVLLESPPAADKAAAYFYFDFRTTECQHEGMIRSLISQLARQCTNQPNPLVSLYSSCGDGARQPKLCELRQTLRGLVQNFSNTFIMVDALDECKEREQLLADIQKFVEWQFEGLHILVTSRREGDIRVTLDPLVNVNQNIDMQSDVVDRDIRVYVREILQSAQGLRRWRNKPLVQDEIEKALTENANWMFRWVVCQIDELKKCLNLLMLRKQLESLPATLPQTYERVLLNIDENYSQYALKMLQWLTYSNRPLSLLELAEVVAIDEDENPRFDPERRFPEPEEILLICSSLVTATEEEGHVSDADVLDDDVLDDDVLDDDVLNNDVSDDDVSDGSRQRRRMRIVKVKLAHFSVKEYLISSQIMDGAARKFSIREIHANVRIARDCLSYMLYYTEDITKAASHEEDGFWSTFPLARYAVESWMEHARASGKINEESMVRLIMELFTSDGSDYSSSCLGIDLGYSGGESDAPLYYASEKDLLGVARYLITMGADVNAPSGWHGNALCVASVFGNTEIVKLLLGAGADPNSSKPGWSLGSALYQATSFGYDAIVRLLLDAVAKAGLEEGAMYDSALHFAASMGNVSIVDMLISSGVDVNINAGVPSSGDNYALGVAARLGYDKVAKMLVEAGANPDSIIAALHVASRGGHEEIVSLLLGTGANPNQSWNLASPLREAVQSIYATTVKILLDAGADVHSGGSWDKNSFSRISSTHGFLARLRERRTVPDLLSAAGVEIIGAEELIKPTEKRVRFYAQAESDED